jgi:DNA-binding NtrC family response regulator
VHSSLYNTPYLINSSEVDDLVIALKRSEHISNIGCAIQSNLIFEELRNGFSLSEIVQEFTNQIEKYIIIKILEFTNGNKSMTAKILKINYKILYYKFTTIHFFSAKW